jgi:hypothetical protein
MARFVLTAVATAAVVVFVPAEVLIFKVLKLIGPLVAVPIVCPAVPLIVTVPAIDVAAATPGLVMLPLIVYVPAPLYVELLPMTRVCPRTVAAMNSDINTTAKPLNFEFGEVDFGFIFLLLLVNR